VTTSTNPAQITGKWHRRVYQIRRKLGQGANGIVYLAVHHNRSYALKVGEDSHSIASEVNVLRHFQKAQGGILGPSVFDVDDWETEGQTKSFYVMNVIEGVGLEQFIRRHGQEWTPIFITQLLDFLHELHEQGWVFGDLKPDNLKVTPSPPRLAWFDAGGMTKMGRAVKEYTEWFDRGYWGMGHRKAEPGYDLFSVAMIMLYLYTGQTSSAGGEGKHALRAKLSGTEPLAPYQPVLWRALNGQYTTARAMKHDLFTAWHNEELKRTSKGSGSKQERATKKSRLRIKKRGNKKKAGDRILSFLFLTSFLLFLFALYLFSQSI
jgi:serine/threonine-protein kinase